MLEHVRDSLNDLKLNNRIKKVVSEVQNIMIELEQAAAVIMLNITRTTNIH